jgi:hypothetical protein
MVDRFFLKADIEYPFDHDAVMIYTQSLQRYRRLKHEQSLMAVRGEN